MCVMFAIVANQTNGLNAACGYELPDHLTFYVRQLFFSLAIILERYFNIADNRGPGGGCKMLSYPQMEKYYQLLQIIDQFKARIMQQRTGLRAARYDEIPGAGYHERDKIGSALAEVEIMRGKLRQLEERRDLMRPEVADTIAALTAGTSKDRIRTELIFTMHYLNGRTLEEIADILHMKSIQISRIIEGCFTQLRRGNHPL